MLELYHGINSVCAQKVRIALKEKGREAKDHIMTLRGDQYEPAYLKLNPTPLALRGQAPPNLDRCGLMRYIEGAATRVHC